MSSTAQSEVWGNTLHGSVMGRKKTSHPKNILVLNKIHLQENLFYLLNRLTLWTLTANSAQRGARSLHVHGRKQKHKITTKIRQEINLTLSPSRNHAPHNVGRKTGGPLWSLQFKVTNPYKGWDLIRREHTHNVVLSRTSSHHNTKDPVCSNSSHPIDHVWIPTKE